MKYRGNAGIYWRVVKREEMMASKEAEVSTQPFHLKLIKFDSFSGKEARGSSGEKITLPTSCSSSGFYLTSRNAIKKGVIKNRNELVFLGRAPLKGLERYLAGRKFKGVGEVGALSFVKEFKEESFEILAQKESAKPNLPPKTKKFIKALRESWITNEETNIYNVFLLELGFADHQIISISECFGDKIIKTLNTQPFSLIQKIKRLSFLDLEKIFKRLSISISEQQRILAATDYLLEKIENDRKHTCVPTEIIFQQVAELLAVDINTVEKVLEDNSSLFFVGTRREKAIISTLDAAEREENLIKELNRISKASKSGVNRKNFDAKDIRTSDDVELSDEQIDAINMALQTPISIITGGPGAGKTTLVQGLVSITKQLQLRTRLCAPTGKAAKRLAENPLMRALKPSTIHLHLAQNTSKKDEFDFMIVDEASMIDVDLLLELLLMIPDGASIVLIGDKDQLPPVASGQPFKDLIESDRIEVSRLTGNFRQEQFSKTVKAARSIIAGELPELTDSFDESDFTFIDCDASKQANTILQYYFDFMPNNLSVEPQAIQILAPQRTGDVGVLRLNELIQERVVKKSGKSLFSKKDRNRDIDFYVGDKVINRKNNYQKNVMNGDQGTILRSAGGNLIIEFDSVEKGTREVEFEGLEKFQLDLAYATTVHSSQGSEYPGVIIPVVSAHSHMLSRNLLYTAVTRGKRKVCIVGEKRAFEIAVKQFAKDFRYTHLCERLQAEI